MKLVRTFFYVSITAMMAVVFVGCDDNNDPLPVVSQTFSNLAADPATGFNPNTGQPTGTTGKFKFFSLSTGAVVANTDSATNKWDLGFRGTTIIVNSGTSGPGSASAQIYTGIFDELLIAPEAGYKMDNKTATPAYAIPTGSGNGWYTATGSGPNSPTIITPIAGKFIVLKTADGKYAKVEILSYYKDAPASPSSSSIARYYTFRYVYQPNATKNFN